MPPIAADNEKIPPKATTLNRLTTDNPATALSPNSAIALVIMKLANGPDS